LDALRQSLASLLEARAVLREVALQLKAADVDVMPLKGVLLQSELYAAGPARRMLDVDVLVRSHDYPRALRLLRATGAVCRANGAWESYVCLPHRRYPVDVHRRLLLPGSFGLSTAEVFARARPDSNLFGAPVWLPDPLDVYAHLVGHFLCSHAQPDDPERLRDFARVSSAGRMLPARCALHLQENGLGRAARSVLPQIIAMTGDGFAAEVLASLPPDRLGDALVRAVRANQAGVSRGGGSARGALSTHLLARSLAAGALGLSLRLVDKSWGGLGSKLSQWAA
jgi:hypothetical protein